MVNFEEIENASRKHDTPYRTGRSVRAVPMTVAVRLETQPLVSVIIPTYNREVLLSEALASVLLQTYSNVEIIVVDDGSSDDTGCVLAGYDSHVVVIRQENRGRSAARNAGVRVAQGEFVVFLDSDDLILPSKIQSQVDYLLRNPAVDVVYGDGYTVDDDGALGPLEPYVVRFPPASAVEFAYSLLCRNHFAIHAALIRRTALLAQPLFDESLTRFEDWDLWIRMCLGGCSFAYINEKVAVYRRHAGNTDMINVTSSRAAAAEILLHVVERRLDRHLPFALRQGFRLYHCDLLVEHGSIKLVFQVIHEIVHGDAGISLTGCQLLLFGLGPRPSTSRRLARSLPCLLARRYVDKQIWQQWRPL